MNGFMKDFIITTDTTTDLPASYVNEHHLGMMSLPYTIENQTYTWEHSLPEKEFYAMMRNGSLPTTSQANPEEAENLFENIIRTQDVDILHISFSSGLPLRKASAFPGFSAFFASSGIHTWIFRLSSTS